MDLLLFYSQVPCYEGKESAAMKELFKVLKDHKNPMIQELVNSSYEHCFRTEMDSLLGEGDLMDSQDCGTEEGDQSVAHKFEFRLHVEVVRH